VYRRRLRGVILRVGHNHEESSRPQGGAGFLGSHLAMHCCRQARRRAVRGQPVHRQQENIAHLLGKPFFEFMRHDVRPPLYVEVDQIYNFACPASPVHYQFDPVQTTKTSATGAINLLGSPSEPRRDPPGVDLGGVRRSRGASADRGVLGKQSIPSASAPATTGKRCAETCSSTTTASTRSTSRSCAYSTPTAAHAREDGAWCRNFIVQALARRGHHDLSATAARRGASATSTTWFAAASP
jgi:UDP-glucuronate decarboxylase